jgi:hypothetical protein
MSLYNYFYILCLFSLPYITFTNKDFVLTSTNYFHHIHCNDNLYIKMNSIKYFYHKYNCTLIVNHHDICSNQSSCILNLKPFLFFHTRHSINECRRIKLKYIQLNYTCVNDTFILVNNLIQPKKTYSFLVYTKNTVIICLCIIIFLSLLALLCSYLRYSSMNNIQEQENSIVNDIQSIYDNQSKQEYEMKNLPLIESSSSSTLTSLNNKNIITNPSEYDNLIKTTSQLHPNDIIISRSSLKVKFNENYQLK